TSPTPTRSPTPPGWPPPSSTPAPGPGSGDGPSPNTVPTAAALYTPFKERSTNQVELVVHGVARARLAGRWRPGSRRSGGPVLDLLQLALDDADQVGLVDGDEVGHRPSHQ